MNTKKPISVISMTVWLKKYIFCVCLIWEIHNTNCKTYVGKTACVFFNLIYRNKHLNIMNAFNKWWFSIFRYRYAMLKLSFNLFDTMFFFLPFRKKNILLTAKKLNLCKYFFTFRRFLADRKYCSSTLKRFWVRISL